MADRQPTLRLHATGVYFARWGGRHFYFTKDKAASERAFFDPKGEHPGALVNWVAWRQSRKARRVRSDGPRLRVIDLQERWLDTYAAEGRDDTEAYFRKHTARFIATAGRLYLDELDLALLDAFRTDLHRIRSDTTGRRFAPKTLHHDLSAVKSMIQWGIDRDLCPPINLRAVKLPRLDPPMAPSHSIETIRAMLINARRIDARLEPWIALNYLCLIRPTDTVRLIGCVHGHPKFATWPWQWADVRMPDGELVEHGAILLKSKASHTTRRLRTIVLSDQAKMWLEVAAPWWTTLSSYSSAARHAGVTGGPKLLQKSAAQHLRRLGESEADVDQLLGHEPSGVRRSYLPIELGLLREKASRLTL